MNWKSKSKKETVGADTASSISEGKKVKNEHKKQSFTTSQKETGQFPGQFQTDIVQFSVITSVC